MTNRKKVEVNDIIGLIKTGEPTNSVELKKEIYNGNNKTRNKKYSLWKCNDYKNGVKDNERNAYYLDEEVVDLLNQLNDIIDPIRKICEKYNIRLEDVAETLEEYICG